MTKLKRILALALLTAVLLALPVLAAAGDGSDPLISRSYVDGTFQMEVSAALDAICGLTVSSFSVPAEEGLKRIAMTAGTELTLTDGQQLILLTGEIRLEILKGSLVNCTLGRGSTGGDARPGHRYVVWDGAEIRAVCSQDATAFVSVSVPAGSADPAPTDPPQPTATPAPTDPPQPTETPAPTDPPQPTATPQPTQAPFPFTDVPAGAWYFADVRSAYLRGLVNGVTTTTYEPQGDLTLAQAVKLAACMHQLRGDGEVTLENAPDGQPWYYTFAGYALENGILTEMPVSGWNAPVTRETFVQLFFRALPESEYAVLNAIPDGAIPDVPANHPAAREVYTFYAAGILTGYTAGGGRAAHAFGPETEISRAEVATIMNRMFDPAARVLFTIG